MFKCPRCRKTNSVRAGLRKNKSGFVQKHLCKECGYLFVDRKGFENMHTNPDIVVTALDLRAQGLSLGKICKHIYVKYNMKISRKSILDWQKKFCEMIDNFTKSFQLFFSENAHADETYLRKKGHKKDEFVYYWDVIDYMTKFLIADHISDEKNAKKGKDVMRKRKAGLENSAHRIHIDNSFDDPSAIRRRFA